VTTGATLADAVRALRRCGVQTVEAWAVARAELATPAVRDPQAQNP
jgi:adenine/guanine phosphoribosyltransferase-like PRPP-binding protein